MAELNLQVGMVGKLLVHYKLVRIPNLVGSITTVEKYLKKNKAVLEAATPAKANGTKPVTNGKHPANGKAPVAVAVKGAVAVKKKK